MLSALVANSSNVGRGKLKAWIDPVKFRIADINVSILPMRTCIRFILQAILIRFKTIFMVMFHASNQNLKDIV